MASGDFEILEREFGRYLADAAFPDYYDQLAPRIGVVHVAPGKAIDDLVDSFKLSGNHSTRAKLALQNPPTSNTLCDYDKRVIFSTRWYLMKCPSRVMDGGVYVGYLLDEHVSTWLKITSTVLIGAGAAIGAGVATYYLLGPVLDKITSFFITNNLVDRIVDWTIRALAGVGATLTLQAAKEWIWAKFEGLRDWATNKEAVASVFVLACILRKMMST